MRSDRRWLAAIAFASLFVAPALGDEKKTDVERILSAGREESQVMEHLDYLVNRIGPRLTSSDNLQNACEWARDRFKSFGIENARLEQWGEFPVGFNRGPWFGKMIEPTAKSLTFGTNAWTAGTKGVVRGPAVMAPTNEEELEKVKDKLPGAWVVIAAGTPGPRGNAPQDEFSKKRTEAYEAAKIAGTIRPARDLIITGGNYQVSWDKLPTTPAINMIKADYDEIVAALKENKPVILEFDIRNYFKKGPIPLYNVIADIPGTEFPDEYVIFGGHIDSWDGATGTNDNGTGCSTTLEAARILMKSGIKPKRTIRFMLWSGEEQGLMGSRAYIKAHPELMPKISAVIVHDGGTNFLSGIGVTKAMKSDIEAALAPIVDLDPAYPFAIREIAGLPRGVGSDHDSFLTAGVPGIFWAQRGGKANYGHIHHTQYDTYDAAIPEYQKHSSMVVALAALGLSNLDHLLSREALAAPPGAGGGGGGGMRALGMQLDEMKIAEIAEGGMAAKAGFKVGDVIIKVGGKPVASREEMRAAMQGEPPKSFVVKREDKEVEIPVTFPPRP